MLVYSLEESECMSGFQTMCPKPMLVTRALAGVTSDVWQVFVNHGDVFHAVMFFWNLVFFRNLFVHAWTKVPQPKHVRLRHFLLGVMKLKDEGNNDVFFLKPYVFQKPFSCVTNLWQNSGAKWSETCAWVFVTVCCVRLMQNQCISIHLQTWNLISHARVFRCHAMLIKCSISHVKRETRNLTCLSFCACSCQVFVMEFYIPSAVGGWVHVLWKHRIVNFSPTHPPQKFHNP